ncbi:MAG: CvpA family protein [Methylobacter sp.]|nr:CvpA family protein [Methylobacter sp.]MDP2428887.1 CvpA family protein [Methylobacter sp.]MDP3053356.1 CvpA family protein [Methylobacter sp.]MDP3362116.1 CvpA family protein [Methylobacter sp.]MDZ4218493.1 CvpA family protein [Methylobacter sp.]
MIWVDFTLGGVIFITLVIGALRGFIKEIFSLLFWLLASWVSLTFSHAFSFFLPLAIHQPATRLAASFIALFAITLALGGLIGFLLGALVKKNQLDFIGRFGGMVSGLLRGIIAVLAVITVAGFTPLPNDSWWDKSVLIPPVQSLALYLRGHVRSDPARLTATSSVTSYKTIQVKK